MLQNIYAGSSTLSPPFIIYLPSPLRLTASSLLAQAPPLPPTYSTLPLQHTSPSLLLFPIPHTPCLLHSFPSSFPTPSCPRLPMPPSLPHCPILPCLSPSYFLPFPPFPLPHIISFLPQSPCQSLSTTLLATATPFSPSFLHLSKNACILRARGFSHVILTGTAMIYFNI